MTDTRRLPKPVAHEWDWQLKGSCQGVNSSIFFHPDGERDLDDSVRTPDYLVQSGIDLHRFGDGVELSERLPPQTRGQ